MVKRSENDKLKNMLIERIKKEGLLILLSDDAVNLLVAQSEKEIWKMFLEFIYSSSESSSLVQYSLVRLSTTVSDRVGQGKSLWNRHRVLCPMVAWMMDNWGNVWSDETIDSVVDYWVKLLECEDMKMVKWAILNMEKWWDQIEMKSWLSSERKDQLITALTRHSTSNPTDTFTEAIYFNLGNTERYQVKWCAKWFEDNLVKGRVKKMPLVKLSSDRFEARNSANYLSMIDYRSIFLPPVRSPFPVKSNVYFYEVTLLTNGVMKFGWSTKESDFSIFEIPDYHSVMLHVGDKCFIGHNGQLHPTSSPSSSCSVNVVGCLLDVENGRFEFYLNGQAFKCPTLTNLSSQPYLATARLTTQQHCLFNFGQSPFKFAPRNIRITTFHEQSGGDEKKYRLMETDYLFEGFTDYWFKHIPVDNQVSLFFDDELQNEFNREVTRVMGDIENDKKISERGLGNVGFEGWIGIRYIQAIIEMKEKLGRVDKVDVMAQWVEQVIENNIDQVYQSNLLELLYPYLQLIPTQSTLTQHRSICIVLLHLFKCCRHHSYKFIKQIHHEVFTYLTRTLTSTHDEWTQLFVLIALTELEMSEAEKRQIEGCAKIGQMVNEWRNQFEEKNVAELLNSKHEHRICYQLYLCSTNLLNSLNPTNSNTNSTLNPNDITPHLLLSPCHLSPRSDWQWQSVRSVCQVSAHIYYFEVVLLTAGPMAIGWATKRTDLNKITKMHLRRIELFNKSHKSFMIGFDEFSIGYDGYNRCIYHDDITFQLENIPRWQAGDIVGCIIDIDKQLFKFYLNGSQINFKPKTKINFNPNSPIYFSTQPYHALISLSQFQQVYLNFGQHPFSSHLPKYVDFYDFYSKKPEVQEIQTKTVVNFQNAHLERNLISIESNVQQEDVIITENESAFKKSIGTETIGNISSVQTLASVNLEQVNNSNFSNGPKMQCRLCYSSTSTKLVRFVCCDTLPLCLDCLRTMTECPKCKKQTNETDENQSNKTNEPIHRCTLCTKQRSSYRFISCDHFNLCQTCVSKISFDNCPRCN